MYLVENRNFTIYYGIRGEQPEATAEKLYAIHQDMWSNSHLSRVPARIIPATVYGTYKGFKALIDLIASTTMSTHNIEYGLEILSMNRPATPSICIIEIVASVAYVPSVTDAVYPYPEVFR